MICTKGETEFSRRSFAEIAECDGVKTC